MTARPRITDYVPVSDPRTAEEAIARAREIKARMFAPRPVNAAPVEEPAPAPEPLPPPPPPSRREMDPEQKAALDKFEKVRRRSGIPARDLLAAFAKAAGVSVSALRSDRRLVWLVHRRQHAMAFLNANRPDLSLPEIGHLFEKDHTTVLHALRAAKARGYKPEIVDPQAGEVVIAPLAFEEANRARNKMALYRYSRKADPVEQLAQECEMPVAVFEALLADARARKDAQVLAGDRRRQEQTEEPAPPPTPRRMTGVRLRHTSKERLTALYATTDRDIQSIAKALHCSTQEVRSVLDRGRRAGCERVAEGDRRRSGQTIGS